MIKMDKKKITYHNFTDEKYTSFKKGIDIQREIYKAAMHDKDYDSAVTALDNIKIEIKNRVIARGNGIKIKKINRVLNWYRILEIKYTRKTEFGTQTIYPIDIEIKVINNLNAAYGIITEQLSYLALI